MAQQNQQPSVLAKQELGLRGTPTSSSQNSLGELLLSHWSPAQAPPRLTASVPPPGLNGGPGSIWDFVSGSFSPSPSPVFSSLSSATSSGDLSRLFRDLDEAKKKLKQWEEAWLQVKQVSAAGGGFPRPPRSPPPSRLKHRFALQACEACQKDAHEAKEQAKTAEAERQLAEQKWEETERKLKEFQGDFDLLCRTPGTPLLRSYGELEQLPLSKLHSIQSQLRSDLDLVDGVSQTSSHTPFHP